MISRSSLQFQAVFFPKQGVLEQKEAISGHILATFSDLIYSASKKVLFFKF